MACDSQTAEIVSGNIFIRRFTIAKAGEGVVGDLHNFDHTTFVTRGRVLARKKRRVEDAFGRPVMVMVRDPITGEPVEVQQWLVEAEREFVAGEHFLIEANKKHDIIGLDDDTRFACIYSHRNTQGEIVQQYDGWTPAYQ